MANRILRDKILTSDRVNALSASAEVFYRRLMSVVDDFGRFDGRLAILRSNLYPLRSADISDADISDWIDECTKSGSIDYYIVDNKPYIEIWNFDQTVRIKKAKYPANPRKQTTSAQHLQASVSICKQETNTCVSGVETKPNQSGLETGVGVGLQEEDFHPPTDMHSKVVWNDMPKPEDVPDDPPPEIIQAAIMQVGTLQRIKITEKDVLAYWKSWKIQYLHGTKHYQNLHEVHSHFLNCIKNQKFSVKNIENEQRAQELSPVARRLLERAKHTGQNTATGS